MNFSTTERKPSRQPESGPDDSKHRRFDSVKKLFRSNSKSEPQSLRTPLMESTSIGSMEPSEPAAPAQMPLPSTRGLFAPAYSRSPEHFAQRRRQRNPILPDLLDDNQRSQNASQVIVRFFNCENLNIGQETLTSPDVQRLLSSAVAFLGECQINDTPAMLLPSAPNPAYRGLALQSAHDGYHIHYPDHAGGKPFHGNVSDDWNKIMEIHAQAFPGSVLFVGVGLGTPGQYCR
ncbi:hypothetical protein EKO27_g5345 [Xylaria grammica]|uniref:Uncharacterized protein n=1 Tax=Xylaria grammica TaxID=363999 RepID=A0A439D5U0_9PEZI|nr:hypothetical protein EKO27_g5345 [Xylaria grammica]